MIKKYIINEMNEIYKNVLKQNIKYIVSKINKIYMQTK